MACMKMKHFIAAASGFSPFGRERRHPEAFPLSAASHLSLLFGSHPPPAPSPFLSPFLLLSPDSRWCWLVLLVWLLVRVVVLVRVAVLTAVLLLLFPVALLLLRLLLLLLLEVVLVVCLLLLLLRVLRLLLLVLLRLVPRCCLTA